MSDQKCTMRKKSWFVNGCIFELENWELVFVFWVESVYFSTLIQRIKSLAWLTNALKHINGDSWTAVHILRVPRAWIVKTASKTYRNLNEGFIQLLRLINDAAERGVNRGNLVAESTGIHSKKFTETVQKTALIQKSFPKSGATVLKKNMPTGFDKMKAIDQKLNKE